MINVMVLMIDALVSLEIFTCINPLPKTGRIHETWWMKEKMSVLHQTNHTFAVLRQSTVCLKALLLSGSHVCAS